jgi:hypothetical protein
MPAAVQGSCDRAAAPTGAAREQGVRLQHGCKARVGASCPVADAGEMGEVAADLALVPREQDRLDIGKVLVQRGAPYACLLGDRRHPHRPQAALGDQRRRSVEDRLAHLAPVRVDRLAPQLRHPRSVHAAALNTDRLDVDTMY